MSKVGKILGVVAGLAALTFAAPFAGLAIGGVAIGGTSGIAARLLTTVAASALMTVSRKGVSAGGGGGITLASTMSGEQQPESIILGRTATGGSAVCPPMSHGDRHSYLTHVVELCSAPGATLERLILNGAYVELGSTPHPDYGRPVLGDYEGLVWVKYYDGSQTTADPMLRAKYGSHPDRPWTAAMVGRGICYAILTFKLDRERLTSVPSYRFQMRGIPLYDPRRDSTAGGSGPQRWTDPATWEQTDNPIVMVHALARGIPLPGGEVYGGKIAAADLPAATWFAAMNECDLAVPRQGGGTERQYRAGLEIQLSEQPAAAIEELLKAAAAEVADVGGIWKVRVGGPGLPVFAITDESLIVTREQDYDPFPGLSEAYNAVTATYPDPEALWESRDAPARTSAELEAQDRFGRKSAALTLPAVPYGLQVQRLMRAWLEDQRRFRKHTGVLPPSGCGLEPLDVVAWTSARNGYEAKLFSLEQVADEPVTCLQGLVAREVDPDDYSWEPGYELPTSIPAPGLTPAAPVVLPDWQCEGITLRDGAGKARRPALKCSWDGEFDRARSIKWEVRLAGAAEVSLRGTTEDVEAGAIIVADGILPAQGYESRGYPYLRNGRGAWSPWMPATTPAVKMGMEDLADEIEEEFREIAQRAGIPTVDGLPPAGDSPNQIVFDMETKTLYRWDAEAGEWTDALYAGIKLGSVGIPELAAGLEPPLIHSGSALPTTRQSSDVLLWNGQLYTWNGSAYVAPDFTIADGSISAQKLASAAVTAAKLANGAVTHAALAAGSVYGDTIAANSITAREMVLTDWGNLITNATFDEMSWSGWAPNLTYMDIIASPTGGPGKYSIRINAGIPANTYARWTQLVPVMPGDQFWVGAWVRANGTAAVFTYRFTIDRFDVDGAAVGSTSAQQGSATTAWELVQRSYTVPDDGTRFIRVSFGRVYSGSENGSATISMPFMRRKNNAELIVDGSITATKLAAEAVTAGKIAVDAITAGTVAAGAIGARELAANSVAAKHLFVGDYSNLFLNPSFDQGFDGWYVPGDVTASVITLTNAGEPSAKAARVNCRQGQYAEIYNSSGNNTLTATGYVSCNPGEMYYIGGWFKRSGGPDADATLVANFGNGRTSVRSTLNIGWQSAGGSSAWFWAEGIVTIPAEVDGLPTSRLSFYASVRNNGAAGTGSWLFTGLVARRAMSGELIVDGAITTNKLLAGSVTADAIATSAIIASKIAVGAVTAAKINVAELSAISANMGTLTAGRIELNFSAGDNGTGILLRGSDGYAELNNVKIRRQIEIDSGQLSVDEDEYMSGGRTIGTNINISAWGSPKRTYLAVCGRQSGLGMKSYVPNSNTWWEWSATVAPRTYWSDGGTIPLRLSIELKRNNISGHDPGMLWWKLYEVS